MAGVAGGVSAGNTPSTPGRAAGGGDAGSIATALLAKCGGATLACGAGAVSGTSIAVCTLPAFTVIVFTFTGLIGSPEPGLGWCDKAVAASTAADWLSAGAEPDAASAGATNCAIAGIASAR